VYSKYDSVPRVSPGALPFLLYFNCVPLDLNSRIQESRLPDGRSMSKHTVSPADTVKRYMSTSPTSKPGSGDDPSIVIAPLTVLPTDVIIASEIWSLGSGVRMSVRASVYPPVV